MKNISDGLFELKAEFLGINKKAYLALSNIKVGDNCCMKL